MLLTRRYHHLALYVLLLFITYNDRTTILVNGDKKRKNRQVLKQQTNHAQREKSLRDAKRKPRGLGDSPDAAAAVAAATAAALAQENAVSIQHASASVSALAATSTAATATEEGCPKCPDAKDPLNLAIDSFWKNDLFSAYSCACHALLVKPDSGLAQAIIFAVSKSKLSADFMPHAGPISKPKQEPLFGNIWELLGPFPSGKLELDACPALAAYRASLLGIPADYAEDEATAILTMPR